jgi:hypothetical protein
MHILCLREFKNNQPLLTCFMFYHGTGCVQPRVINWPFLCIPKPSRWHTWKVSLYLLLQPRASVVIFDNPALFLLFEIRNSNFQIFFSYRNLRASGFADVCSPHIKCDWTSVRLLRRATGDSSTTGLEGWNLDETLRLPVTGDRLTRVTC